VATVAAVVVAATLLSGCSGGDSGDAVGTAGGWRVMAASPLQGRFFPASEWTGREFVLWGGGRCSGDFCNSAIAEPLADGAAYDPAADRWRTIAPSPLGPRLRAMSTWTGRELLVWGGNAEREGLGDGAAYDPEADRWRPLADSPLSGRFGASSVWTGTEWFVWGGGAGGQQPDEVFGDGAAYDPAADRWRPLSPSPLAARTVGGGVWTGTEVIFWGGSTGEESRNDGAAYDPVADRWRLLADSPLQPRGTGTTVWTGREVVIWGGGDVRQSFDDGAAYDPAADRWRPLAESPLQPRRAFARAWTGRELLVWGGGPDNSLVFYGSGAAYDPAADRWRELPSWNARFGPSSAWTGQELLVWGGIFAPARIEVLADGARLRVDRPAG
jgi:N-acetylneuraminic acid mutarotase